ncbi:MAG: hypothetical protein BVN35_05395 [Proteobacteria bacterium ST_bin11]|nr:MAG: hypothetical protein BVN35_05395 [Proteobacteria bacterium ST_bin11]
MIETSTEISQKILFVDDEALLLEGLKRQFRREFDIEVAQGGEAALALMAESAPFAVVVSDYNMPVMDGIAFLNQIYNLYPQTVLMMLTGRAELNIAVNALHDAHISRFLNKPCPKEVLVETLNDGLEQYRLRMSEHILQAQLQQTNQQLNALNNHLEELVAQKTLALRLQYQYVANMTQLRSSREIIDALIDSVAQLTQLDAISLWLSPQQDGKFSCHYPRHLEANTFSVPEDVEAITYKTIKLRQVWRRGDTKPNAFDQSLFAGQPLFSVPLVGNNGVLGLLNLAGEDINLVDQAQEAMIGIADVTATALQSHWHREAFEEAQDAIITALAKLSEYRDPETGAHLLRLKKYCGIVCGFLAETEKYRSQISPMFTEDLVRSSPLHDIGKVGIPDAILKKPGKLSPEEFEIMKTHAQIGGDTLRAVYEQYPSQSFIKCGMDIAYCHHEKWNGQGYPKGLAGDAIPLSARILALVDVYDALTSRRVYKAPFPREKATGIITEGSGNHFDPDIVTAFLANEDAFYEIAEQFADLV